MNRNASSGLFFVLLSAYVAYRAYGFGLGDLFTPGPGFMFFAAALVTGTLGLHLFFASILKKKGQAAGEAKGRPWRILPVFLTFFLYVVLFRPLGYLLSTFLFLTFLFAMPGDGGRARLIVATAGGAATSLLTYLVFAKLFALSLPAGLLYF